MKNVPSNRPQQRTVNFHALFCPNGPALRSKVKDEATFIEFCAEAFQERLKIKTKNRKLQKKQFEKVVAAQRKIDPILDKLLCEPFDPANAAKKSAS